MLNKTSMRIENHSGKWYVINEWRYKGKMYFLLENTTFGDEAASVIVDENGYLILDEVYQISDFYEFVDDIDYYHNFIDIKPQQIY